MDQQEPTPIRGTEGALEPFFSPDGQWVGLFADGEIKRVAVTGGAPVTLCEVDNPFGPSWSSDDTILFGAGEGISGSQEQVGFLSSSFRLRVAKSDLCGPNRSQVDLPPVVVPVLMRELGS